MKPLLPPLPPLLQTAASCLVAGILLGLGTGCSSSSPNPKQPFVFPGTAPATASEITSDTLAALGSALTNSSTSELRPGENIRVTFSDLPPGRELPPMDVRIGENGKITLLFSVTFDAAGKTASQLQQEIRAAYVPKYFKELTVMIRGAELIYFVGGEVRSPGLKPYLGHMTVLRAVDTASGFTEYAKKTKIKLIRATGEEFIVDGKKAVKRSEFDLEVMPNDRIYVPRRGW
ncbi:MAG: polysaccharide biosynthesis/export family protein [Verrucomicrobia bacterium]|nr:polysaccharide biosynthesis/export family protein [Verrucomicrobiota bacterium]